MGKQPNAPDLRVFSSMKHSKKLGINDWKFDASCIVKSVFLSLVPTARNATHYNLNEKTRICY